MPTASVVCIDPKFAQNIGSIIRACACYGVTELRGTGRRVQEDLGENWRVRIPREERMKGYSSVNWKLGCEKPLDDPAVRGIPVCVELRPGAIPLPLYQHPDDAVYVFGPEDGSVPQVYRKLCHDFIVVPTHHCLNLAVTVATVLYDRRCKRILAGLEPGSMDEILQEERYSA